MTDCSKVGHECAHCGKYIAESDSREDVDRRTGWYATITREHSHQRDVEIPALTERIERAANLLTRYLTTNGRDEDEWGDDLRDALLELRPFAAVVCAGCNTTYAGRHVGDGLFEGHVCGLDPRDHRHTFASESQPT